MDWNSLSFYLKKYKNIKPPNEYKIKAVVCAIKEEADYKLEEDNVTIQGSVAKISKTSFSNKNNIYIKKEKILKNISENIGNNIISDIR